MMRDRKASATYLENVTAKAGVGRFKDLEQHRGGQQAVGKTAKQQQMALAHTMTLVPFYFAEELYSSKDQQCVLNLFQDS